MHVSLLSHEPNPDGTCRVCRSPIDSETLLCNRCGAAYGEKNRCPHCRTISRTVPHPQLIHRCSVCGKPRFPPGPLVSPLGQAPSSTLVCAAGAHKSAQILRILTGFLSVAGTISVITLLLFLWVANFGIWGNVLGLFVALVPWLLAAYCYLTAKNVLQRRDAALTQSYEERIVSILSETRTLATSTQIAAWLGLSVERTEVLLTELNVDDRMTSDVTEDGELVYGVSPERVRIAEQPKAQRIEASTAIHEKPYVTSPENTAVDVEFDELSRTESKPRHRS